MPVDVPSNAEAIAKNVDAVVNAAPSTRSEAELATEKKHELMKATMANMEAAKARVGDYCVTLGNPDNPNSYGMVLATPVVEPYDPKEYAKMLNSPVGQGGTDTRESKVYVVATPEGFYQVDAHMGKYSAYISKYTPTQEGAKLDAAVRFGVGNGGQITSEHLQMDGRALRISQNGETDVRFVLSEADPQVVDKALKASLQKAQEQYKPEIQRSQTTEKTVQGVHNALGMEPPKVDTRASLQAAAKPGGFFGLFRGKK